MSETIYVDAENKYQREMRRFNRRERARDRAVEMLKTLKKNGWLWIQTPVTVLEDIEEILEATK